MYCPREDSFFLSDFLKKHLKKCLKNNSINKKGDKKINKEIKILDMGSGSGIQSQTCKNLGFDNILCVDINSECIKHLKSSGFKTIKSDLFSNKKLKNRKFDLIIFNPPYLPSSKYDKEKDTTGGKKGFETILKFLQKARNHLTDNGKILLLFSSLSSPEIIKKKAKDIGYSFSLFDSKKLFFEKLYIYKLKIKNKEK